MNTFYRWKSTRAREAAACRATSTAHRSHRTTHRPLPQQRGAATMARSRRADPDGVLDPDRGSSDASTKRAKLVPAEEHQERSATREGARGLDQAVEDMPGLTRQQRDRERAMPRDVTGDVPHPQMRRQLPEPDSIRAPLSSRQRKTRSVTKRAVQDRLPQTQYDATARLVGDPSRWQTVNDVLSDAAGDAQELDDATRVQVQRIDRAIQAYERGNDRGHVVYANVEMPTMINSSNLEGYVRAEFTPGSTLDFDRFTGAAHTMHEVEPTPATAHRTAVFEIQTRRGMYLGRSDSLDDTAHLLPRGLRLRITGSHLARYRRPDGTIAARHIVQLVDDTPT